MSEADRSDPYISASCPLQSVAGSEKWDTTMAASWGSSTTYTDKRSMNTILMNHRGDMASVQYGTIVRNTEIKQHTEGYKLKTTVSHLMSSIAAAYCWLLCTKERELPDVRLC